MADRNRQAERKNSIPAQALVCLLAMAAPCGLAWAAAPSAGFAPASYIGELDPNLVWELLLGGIAVVSFLVAIGIWILTALRGAKRAQLRRSAFISSALNTLNQGVMMTNAQNRVVFCNDRFLEMYGLSRAEISNSMTGRELAELRLAPGLINLTVDEFAKLARRPEGVVTELPDGRSVLSKIFTLPNGESVGRRESVTEQCQLSRKLAASADVLESVLDSVPVYVAAKTFVDGRYIFANRAFERFSRFSRDHIIGKRADEIFRPETAKSIETADQAAVTAPEGYHRSEYVVERGDDTRVLSSNRVVARNENNKPEFLIALFDDVTDRRSLSRELENTKKFLELVVDNIPVSLIVERISDGRYLLANRSAETILNRRREDATGLTAADIFNPKEAKLIIARDEAAIRKGGLLTEEHPISTKDGLRLFLTRRMTVLDGAGEPQYLIKTHEDVTDRRQTESRMAHMAYHDGLTDLPNRAAFLQALAQMIEACEGTDEEFAVLSVDLDGMKEVNDVFGPAIGDKLLIEVARRLQTTARDGVVARLSGDEFGLIKNGELSLHYQPQAMSRQTAASSEVIGFEALARWHHPVRGFVPPADFIPLAEESGLIVEMGEWILREACREAASWPMPLQIAVNLSPAQFMHGDMVSLLHSILLETGLAPGRLELEITEGVLIEDFDRGLALLRRLKALGVRISMDDFGSGYSSLSYLQAFPFDKIKIDRAFVMNLGRNPQSAAIVRAVIDLGHGLEMSIVAEGVETQE